MNQISATDPQIPTRTSLTVRRIRSSLLSDLSHTASTSKRQAPPAESAAWREHRGHRGGSGCQEGVHRGAERSWKHEHCRGAPDDADGFPHPHPGVVGSQRIDGRSHGGRRIQCWQEPDIPVRDPARRLACWQILSLAQEAAPHAHPRTRSGCCSRAPAICRYAEPDTGMIGLAPETNFRLFSWRFPKSLAGGLPPASQKVLLSCLIPGCLALWNRGLPAVEAFTGQLTSSTPRTRTSPLSAGPARLHPPRLIPYGSGVVAGRGRTQSQAEVDRAAAIRDPSWQSRKIPGAPSRISSAIRRPVFGLRWESIASRPSLFPKTTRGSPRWVSGPYVWRSER